MKTINQKQAFTLLKSGQDISVYKVIFNDEKIEALDCILLGKNNIEVPEKLISYNDDLIDFSDDPDITDEDLASGKLLFVINTELSLKYEIKQWLQKENINLNELASKLVSDFFETHKNLPKKES